MGEQRLQNKNNKEKKIVRNLYMREILPCEMIFSLAAIAPLDLAIRHFVMRPCSISSGIVRNADVPNSLPIAKFAFEFDVVYLDRLPHFVAIRPYFLIYDPDVV